MTGEGGVTNREGAWYNVTSCSSREGGGEAAQGGTWYSEGGGEAAQ